MKMNQTRQIKELQQSVPELSLVVQQDPHSLREKTAAKLREAIIAGYFKPGEQLVERDVCAKTDVSRTSLREAFRHLETEGVVESRKGEGVFVKVLSLQDVRDIYELRMALDAEAVWYFSERASEEHRSRLRAITDQMKDVAFNDTDRAVSSTNEFFATIYEGAGNKLARDTIQSLQTRISLLRAITSRSSNEGRYHESLSLTREMVGEIEKGNSRKAAKLARQYAARSLDYAMAVLSQADMKPQVDTDSRPKRTAKRSD